MKRILLAVLLFSGVGLWSAPALALVGIISCSATAGSISFGDYDPLAGSHMDSTGSITFSCTQLIGLLNSRTVSFEIQLAPGSSGSFALRTMRKGVDTLEYSLYTDSARTTVWGSGSGGTRTRSGSLSFSGLLNVGVTKKATFTTYGRVFAGQFVSAGGYEDNITVTVLY